MHPTIHIQYRDVPPSAALTQLIETELQRLGRHHAGLAQCRVTVARPHQHHRHGRRFEVALNLTTGLGEVVVNHHPSAHALRPDPTDVSTPPAAESDATHTDAYATIREAFDTARRRLDEQARRYRTRRHADDGALVPGA